jgi:hypothetical protein
LRALPRELIAGDASVEGGLSRDQLGRAATIVFAPWRNRPQHDAKRLDHWRRQAAVASGFGRALQQAFFAAKKS